MTFKVVKRSGDVVAFSPDNINNMAIWAIKGNEKYVNWSDLVMLAMHQLPKDIVTTVQIQESLIKAALEMETPAYNRVAGRLLLGNMRKVVKVSRDFKEYYKFATESGLWRRMNWSDEDVEYFASLIDHERDLEYGYPTIRQFVDKFGRKDSDGNLCELPQYAFMGIAMSLFEGCSRKDVALYYKKASEQKINIPSPIMSGQRTPSNIGVSCVIATAGDSVQGIEAAKHIMSIATASSAGLGVEYDIRSPLDDVRNGYAKAGGKLPHYKVAEFITKELKQTNRGGSATVSFRVIDPEVLVLLGLKLPRSPEERRITQLDYSLLWNTSFLRRVAKKGKWPLVSLKQCPELHEKFSGNPDEYDLIVEKVLANDTVEKIVVDAWEIWETWVNNRSETGRIYRTNLTHVNSHTPFNQEIRLSNLC
jgi:ribonucleoside-diphosphate reductase alpha chain